MDNLTKLLKDVPFPRVVRIEQEQDTTHIEPEEIEALVSRQLTDLPDFARIQPGQRIAITAGSRGINGMVQALRAVVAAVRARGAEPFLVPAMGSHGGATAKGQLEMLAGLGVTEESVGAPILSSMEADQIGAVLGGRPVFLDHNANTADGIILANRVKCHTSFRGPYESGLMKMMAIGLGKQKGAQHYHQTGFGQMSTVIEAVGSEVLRQGKVVCGVAIVENSFGKAVHIEAINAAEIPARERELLVLANSYLPKMFCDSLDVCAIGKIGKDISGTGMDTNVVGRFPEHPEVGPAIRRICILDLSDVSHGNANGVGRADCITRRLYEKMKPDQFYPNAITSTAMESARIPMVLPDDRMAIAVCITTSLLQNPTAVRLALIESTKNMNVFYVSENLEQEAREKGAKVVGEPFEIPFDENGALQLRYT